MCWWEREDSDLRTFCGSVVGLNSNHHMRIISPSYARPTELRSQSAGLFPAATKSFLGVTKPFVSLMQSGAAHHCGTFGTEEGVGPSSPALKNIAYGYKHVSQGLLPLTPLRHWEVPTSPDGSTHCVYEL